jgi:hypothetical protein
MSEFYHQGSRELQDRFDTRRLADRLEQRLVVDRIGDADKAFIESLDMFFLATNYDGNGMFLSMGNIAHNPRVGMLFIDFERQRRLRLSGQASISNADPLLTDYAEAQFIIRVAVTRVFPNCPRYIHKYRRVEPSTFVPRAGCETPVPNWKKSDWACDVLPEKDPARSR